MEWYIGNVKISNQVVLAPMAGVSNPSYMKIAEDMGCGYAITELISSEAIVRDNKKTFDMLNGIEKLKMPVAVQIFGSNPVTMANAAKILVDRYKVKIIDINMGCPVPKVIKAKSGSYLMKEPDLVREIVKSVSSSVDVPVTVKIRSGWDDKSINAIEIAKICEEAGACAISIHARTRAQGYSGKANWDVIRDVVNAVKIPVIGNGDVISPVKAKEMLDYTKCKAVMIGRGVLGNPWLIKQCVDYLNNGIVGEISISEKLDTIKKHYDILLDNRGEKVATLEIRSHILWYFKFLPNGKEVKKKIMECKTKEEIDKVLNEYIKGTTF